MQKNLKNNIIRILIIANLLIASIGAVFAQNVSGEVTVEPCATNCFVFDFPNDKTLTEPIFLDPTGDYIFVNFNYNLGDDVYIKDSRTALDTPPRSSSWDIYLNASNLISNSDPSKFIPYTDIGIMSFNNDSTTVDSTTGDNTVESLIDTTVISGSPATEPFDQADLTSLTDTPPTDIEDYYRFFTGTNAQSDSVQIMTAPSANQRPGAYTMGLALIIKTPANPQSTLISDDYSIDLLYTILL
ncbi:hypothetical protein GF376_00440 [Candidatus Peregrinibacteria bacterium]|nr:hypothetical protein [Candidatus Peregrinibacteria bacterium]